MSTGYQLHFTWYFSSPAYNNNLQFGIEDLKNEPEETACWDGVRNYQVIQFILMCYTNIGIEDSC